MSTHYNFNHELVAEFGLCADRHSYPVEECIFDKAIAFFAFTGQESDAEAILAPLVSQGLKRLVIYASGCTPALLSAINVAQRLKIREITVMHFDAIRETYQAQRIATLNDIYQ